jgi:hypothetical protein
MARSGAPMGCAAADFYCSGLFFLARSEILGAYWTSAICRQNDNIKNRSDVTLEYGRIIGMWLQGSCLRVNDCSFHGASFFVDGQTQVKELVPGV